VVTYFISYNTKKFFFIPKKLFYDYNVSSSTIHIKGTDNAKININNNEKEGVTTILIINAFGPQETKLCLVSGAPHNCLQFCKGDKY